ncbi:MAG TPA: uroporphyrinogen decarboxylase family protein [Anaerolineae bacterium]|nr:uroporphyrinogen decarboxylase family protein [Anaerolineae bacterium]HQK14781.1 uroporphyrinogen decarboxylase family protein [Anaerolineae bacterium]
MTTSITGKALLLATLRHEPTPAVPWVPFAGVHAGKLKGYTAREVLTDADKLFESLLAVNQTYDPDGQPVVFDLQIEAEILGCDLVWVEKGPPTVASHPLAERMEVPTHLPEPTDGRLPLILDVMRRMKAAVGEHTALYGLVTGPFTLASHLRGTEIFMDMFDHPDFLRDLLAFCRDVAKRMAAFYIEAGMDVIAVVDPLVSQVSPRHFNRLLSAPFSDIFAFIRERGAYSSFFVCGDATKNIEGMCHTGPDSISIDENIDLVAAKRITDAHNITIGGNIPLTTRMLLGTQQDNMKFVADLLAQVTPHNFILAPGCDMPYDTPIENVVGVLQAVRDPETTRVMLANYHAEELDLDAVILPDYAALERPLVEVFTLDSDTCSACGYMRDAALRAVAEFAGQVDVVEYKFTQKENVARVVKMGVQKLPSIYINGKLAYASIIPSNRELVEKIRRIIN